MCSHEVLPLVYVIVDFHTISKCLFSPCLCHSLTIGLIMIFFSPLWLSILVDPSVWRSKILHWIWDWQCIFIVELCGRQRLEKFLLSII